MKFRDISERVKGGKLDPLSKMGKQKLTGREISQYYRDNPKAKQAAKDPLIKKAIELALDLGGAYSYAVKEIGKLNRNLPRHPEVKKALQTANESVNEISEAHFATYHTPNQKKSMKDFIALAKKMPGVSDVTSEKQKNSRGQPIFRTSYKTDNRTADKLQKQQSALEKKYKEESVETEMTSTSSVAMPEIPLGRKHKVMKRKDLEEVTRQEVDAMKKVSKDMQKVLVSYQKIANMGDKELKNTIHNKSYKQVLDARDSILKMIGTLNTKMLLRKEDTELNEEVILYRIKDIQKPELDKFKSSARLMKLKINIKQSPMKKDTLIRLQGSKKQINDFDAVVRGKSSYGDPSLAMKENVDLNEESATMKKVRQVVKKKGMMNIDGMKLDLTTASMIASVYDKVNPMNKKRMDKLKLPQLVNLTMKVAGKGKMKKEDAVERAKELADLKAKHKREVEQEKDEIAATKQTNESLWRNIHNKRKSGKKMRKPGEKGAPTAQDFKNARGEAVSPAQQAAIAISKKERGEKPKNECADEKDFKPHKMYKGDKEVMANTYADHVKYDKMGYTHEKPKKEALDAKDKPFVKDLVKKLRGGSKTHAKQADDLEKALNTESMSRARADAMRDMGKRKDRDDDGNPVATADDRKAADKNVVMQIRKVTDLQRPTQIELRNGKKVMLKPADAKMMMKKFDAIRKPQDRLKVQNAMNDKKMTVQGLKRLLGK